MYFPPLCLQMILERRANQGLLRLIQSKDTGCVSSREKPSVKECGEKGPVAGNGDGDVNHEEKPQHEKTDGKNHMPSHPGVTKPEPANVSTEAAVERTSPSTSHRVGKLTYNPITHAPSRF